MVVVVVVVGALSVFVPAFAVLPRATPLLFGHSDPDLDVGVLTPGAVPTTAPSPSNREAHFQSAPLMLLLLQGDLQDDGRRAGKVGVGGGWLLVMLLLLLPQLLANESLGGVGILPLHAGFHVLQLPLLSGQHVGVLGPVLAQGHLGGGVDLAVGLLRSSFSCPGLRAAGRTLLLVTQQRSRRRQRETHQARDCALRGRHGDHGHHGVPLIAVLVQFGLCFGCLTSSLEHSSSDGKQVKDHSGGQIKCSSNIPLTLCCQMFHTDSKCFTMTTQATAESSHQLQSQFHNSTTLKPNLWLHLSVERHLPSDVSYWSWNNQQLIAKNS